MGFALVSGRPDAWTPVALAGELLNVGLPASHLRFQAYAAAHVDRIASSMVQTEWTMNELQFATGLDAADKEAPELVQRQSAVTKK